MLQPLSHGPAYYGSLLNTFFSEMFVDDSVISDITYIYIYANLTIQAGNALFFLNIRSIYTVGGSL